MGLWAKSIVIFNAICDHGKQSIRSLADRTGLSKSSVHRHLQAIDRRDHSPGVVVLGDRGRPRLAYPHGRGKLVGVRSQTGRRSRDTQRVFWPSSPGSACGVRHPVPCEVSCTRWNTSSWKRPRRGEKEGIAHGEIRPVIGAVDETFLQHMILVFMDLATGYLLMEEVATDRSFDTWYDRASDRLTTFGTQVLYLVSDRAKALIKLAHTGLGCPSIRICFTWAMTWPRGIRFASSVVCAKPNGTSSKPDSAWRRCKRMTRETVSTSHRHRAG